MNLWENRARKCQPCTELGCSKPTKSNYDQCQPHIRGYYMIQYVNRLHDKAFLYDSLEAISSADRINIRKKEG